jgi:hypothetical protein
MTTRPDRTALLLATLTLGGPAAASATEDPGEATYEAAVAAAQAGESERAAALFEDALGQMPTEHPLRTLALYGSARAHERIGAPRPACAAVERFTQFIGRADAEAEKRVRASNALPGLISLCSQDEAAAPPPSTSIAAPSPAAPPWAWATTVTSGVALVAGGVLCVLARGAVDDGDAAYDRFTDDGRVDADTADDVSRHDERARTLGYSGLATLGVGLVVGAVATWLWLGDDAASSNAAVEPTPEGLGFGLAF